MQSVDNPLRQSGREKRGARNSPNRPRVIYRRIASLLGGFLRYEDIRALTQLLDKPLKPKIGHAKKPLKCLKFCMNTGNFSNKISYLLGFSLTLLLHGDFCPTEVLYVLKKALFSRVGV